MYPRIKERMTARAGVLLVRIDSNLNRILLWWLILASAASVARIAMTPYRIPIAGLETFYSYFLLVAAPVASALLALHWFSDGHLQPQPAFRLARLGRWVPVHRTQAQSHSLYGASGVMVSLLVGMMLNVPVRALEYFGAMPPIPEGAPHWLSTLHFAMTLDVVLFGSLYMIAFVAALRRVPLFPRLLVAIWLGDLAMQIMTAQLVASTNVPAGVAHALQAFLTGNVKKVLISMALWLPYLLLSKRVNITYRHRIPA
jgi:hypothetical protein